MASLDTPAPERIRALEDALHIAVGFLSNAERTAVSDRWLKEWRTLLGEQTQRE
jgi:hypothetical protein